MHKLNYILMMQKKLQTDNTGITVTGTAVATTFSGSGVV